MKEKFAVKLVMLLSVGTLAFSAQINISKVEQMPNQPTPYQMRNWQQVAHDFDAFVFDFSKTGQYLPVPWWDTTHYGGNPTGFGMPSYIGRFLQSSGTAHESICTMGAVLGATLAGIDKSNQNGYNWVLMLENYFSSTQNLYLNNIGGVTGQSFWYETLPSILFYQLNYFYPNTGNFSNDFITTADRWYDACVAMGGKISPWTLPNFNWTAFNFSTMAPYYNGVWRENDAPAAIGWVEYIAYIKTGDTKYLTAAKWCMEYLQAQTSSPLYDVLLVYAPYIALRMNMEQGTNYDVTKLINWCFTGNSNGWGVLGGATWGDLGVDGLMGIPNYSFELESLHLAGAVVPMPRYDQRYARAMGKYMLNLANSVRLYYSYMYDANHQTSSDWAFMYDPDSCIGYEGLKKTRVRYAHAAADYNTSPGSIISGNYSKTWAKDEVYEVLKEGPTTANNQLEHIWSFQIDADPAYWDKLVIHGHMNKLGSDNDTGFDMYWSTSPTGPWNFMFTINQTDRDYWIDGNWAGGAGQLYIRASDNYKTGRGEMDELYIDEIWIECKNNAIQPYASGDPLSYGWGNTDLGLYGSAYVGILGGIVKTTNVEKILQLDLLKTDYYRSTAYPTYLYYNPYTSAQTLDVNVGTLPVDIYDTVSQGMVKVNVTGVTQVNIPADSAQVLVLAPAGGTVTISGNKKLIHDVIVDYQTNTAYTTCPQVQASSQRLPADINGDCKVNIFDLEIMSQNWLNTGDSLGRADIVDNNSIDFYDFAALGSQWLTSNDIADIQLESFDNFAADGWVDGHNTGLMIQSVTPDRFYEGAGALRVKFEARTTQWDISPTRTFSSAIDMSGKSLSFMLWTDLVNDAILKQVIVFDNSGRFARFTVTRPSITGWTEITAPLSAFAPDGAPLDFTQIKTVQFWFSTWDTPGNSLYIDDLRLGFIP
jgi:hypothetical protein